jgi:hypothetical protein
MKFYRRIRRFVQTGLLLWSPSRDNTLKGLFVRLNRFNFIRIQCLSRAEAFPWVAHLCGSNVSVLSQVPSTLLYEEYK